MWMSLTWRSVSYFSSTVEHFWWARVQKKCYEVDPPCRGKNLIISLQESEAQGLGKVDILEAESAVVEEAMDDMITSSRGEFTHSYTFAVPGMNTLPCCSSEVLIVKQIEFMFENVSNSTINHVLGAVTNTRELPLPQQTASPALSPKWMLSKQRWCDIQKCKTFCSFSKLHEWWCCSPVFCWWILLQAYKHLHVTCFMWGLLTPKMGFLIRIYCT